jgi:hypothetical protein
MQSVLLRSKNIPNAAMFKLVWAPTLGALSPYYPFYRFSLSIDLPGQTIQSKPLYIPAYFDDVQWKTLFDSQINGGPVDLTPFTKVYPPGMFI